MYDFNTKNELEVTVALIGQSNSGKSTLRALHNLEQTDKEQTSSVEVKLFDRLEFYDEFSVRMYIWDLPGNEKLSTYTSPYISNADAVVIMYDTTSKLAYSHTERLIKSVQKLKSGQDYCLYLFGNKNDLLMKRLTGTDKMMKLSMKYGIPLYEGSLRNEMNLDKMFYELAKE